MSHVDPASIALGAVTVAIPNVFVQAALAAGDGVAAWGVFVTTLCGGLGFLVKTWWDGKNRAEKVAEALSDAKILKEQVDRLEARHAADMEWIQKVTGQMTGRIDRSRERVQSLSDQVHEITGSSDTAILPETIVDLGPMPGSK